MVPPAVIIAAIVLPAALIIDRIFGDPHSTLHPVTLLGRVIGWWGRPRKYRPSFQRTAGVVFWVVTVALFSLPFIVII